MVLINLLTKDDRVLDIESVTKGDLAKYGVSDFEVKVFESLKKVSWGSSKQLSILSNIEIKVFGYARDKEEKKKMFRLGTV